MRKQRLMLIALLVTVSLVAATAGALFANRAPLIAPPGVAARLSVYLSRNVAEVTRTSPFPELRSPRYRLPADRIAAEVADAARTLGFEDVAIHDSDRRVTAVAVSSLFGFRDDLEVVVEERDGVGTVLARSSSRLGRADLGANQNHLRRLLGALQIRLADSAVGQ